MKNRDRKPVVTVTAADCRVETFCTGGPGGQNQNKVHAGVRFTHKASGAVGESRNHRSQIMNKREAWKRMCETKKFQSWIRLEHAKRLGQETVEQKVDRLMAEGNIKTEVLDEGSRWQKVDPKDLKDES